MTAHPPPQIGSSENKFPRSRSSLDEQLKRQLGYLENSAKLFDAGNHDEANRLATTLRVLLHDTNKSTSLLTHLGIKSTLQFIDTGLYRDRLDAATNTEIKKINPDFVIAGRRFGEAGLVEARPTASGTFTWVAPLRETRFAPTDPCHSASVLPQPFDAWWHTPLIEASDGRQFSRGNLILIMANQDGGAHVDSGLDKDYLKLCVDFLGAQMRIVSEPTGDITDPNWGHDIPTVENNVAFASVRQVSFEVQLTLQRYIASKSQPSISQQA